jgi:hypothetical protein
VARADPSRARLYHLAGTAERWCIEVAWYPEGTFFDVSPMAEWVSVTGRGGDHERRRHQRCPADLGLHLSASWATGGPADGTIAPAQTVPAGTCLAFPYAEDSPAGSVDRTGQVVVRDCTVPHHAEVYHVGEITEAGLTFDSDRMWRIVGEACQEAFHSYVGVPDNLSIFLTGVSPPPRDAWEAGDRRFTCLLSTEDVGYYALHGSARDSWR